MVCAGLLRRQKAINGRGCAGNAAPIMIMHVARRVTESVRNQVSRPFVAVNPPAIKRADDADLYGGIRVIIRTGDSLGRRCALVWPSWLLCPRGVRVKFRQIRRLSTQVMCLPSGGRSR